MKKSLILILSLVLGLLLSCENNDGDNEDNQLTGIRWILVKQVGQAGSTLPTDVIPEPGEEYWIEFAEDGSVSILDACNYCSASFDLGNNNSLVIHHAGCTDMACAGLSRLELNSTFAYSFENDTLALLDEISFSAQSLYFIKDLETQ